MQSIQSGSYGFGRSGTVEERRSWRRGVFGVVHELDQGNKSSGVVLKKENAEAKRLRHKHMLLK